MEIKTCLFTIVTLLSIVGLGYGQNEQGCAKPLELFNCKSQVSDAGNDFCKTLGKIRKCFEEDAQCSKEFFHNLQDATEKALNVKCDASCLSVPAVLLFSALVSLVIKRR